MSCGLEVPIFRLPGTAKPLNERPWTPEGASEPAPVGGSPSGTWGEWIAHAPAVTTSGGGGGGRALLISYTFPPTGGSGVQRAAKLVKYLPAVGWQVEVLAAGHQRFPWSDPSLMADLPTDTRVHRVRGLEPACLAGRIGDFLRWLRRDEPKPGAGHTAAWSPAWIEERFFWRFARWAERLGLGDGSSLWIAAAVRAALARHRTTPFDVIVSTGPPVVAHQVALRIAHATGLPWVADVRDPFVSDFDWASGNGHHAQIMRRLERQVMRRAAMVVTTCEALVEDLLARYPHRTPQDVRAITNGFDRDDVQTALAGQYVNKPSECVFVAAGAFYGRRELSRIVEPISRVLAKHPQWQGRLRLVVAGTLDAKQQRYWKEAKPSWMRLAGYLDHAAVIRLIAESACSVVLVPDCRHTRQCIPGKLFELLALPTHLLMLAPPQTETAALASNAGASAVVPMEDPHQVENAIERIAANYLSGNHWPTRPWPRLDAYDRQTLAAQFADTLTNAVSPKGVRNLFAGTGKSGRTTPLGGCVEMRPAKRFLTPSGSKNGLRMIFQVNNREFIHLKNHPDTIFRLAFVSDAPGFGGAERYILAMIRAAQRRDMQAHLHWAPQKVSGTFFEAAAAQLALTAQPSDAKRFLTPFLATPEQTRSLRGMIRAFRQMLATHRPDGVVINACGRPRFWLYPWLARWVGIPVVWVHQMVEARDHRRQRPQWFGGRMEGLQSWRVPQALRHRLAAAAATAVIVLNEEDGRRITRWQGVNPTHIHVVPHGVDLHEFRFSPAGRQTLRRQWSLPDSANTDSPNTGAANAAPAVIGTAGRLVAGKGIDLLIEAVGILRQRRVPCSLVIAGDGPDRADMANLAQQRGITDAVHFAGFVDDMPAFYSALDIFALCSLTESFGLALAEAMACERPVVGTPTDGAARQIIPGHNGCLLPSFAPTDLADALEKLIRDPQRCRRMGQAGRQTVTDHFSIDLTLDRTLRALRAPTRRT